nr:MAG TPA: hypothetical protein [Caudoviricetes sp.]
MNISILTIMGYFLVQLIHILSFKIDYFRKVCYNISI